MNLQDELKGIVEDALLDRVPKRFDYIGDVAVISIPPELETYRGDIAEKLVSMRGNTRAVLNKVSRLEGKHRVAGFELLLGDSTETVHRENGYAYRLDVRKVFFNPRLYWERGRVAAKVIPSENVLIPFCGVGPFVLPAAGKGAGVLAIELNPDACACLRENIRLNRLDEKITVVQGDAEEVFRQLEPGISMPEQGFDRAIVPTPYGLDRSLGEVAGLVRTGGSIHFYTFKAESQLSGLIEEYEKMGLRVEFFRRSGNVAPGISRWAFDLVKK
ncbi:class I SAM-dependent methyltransferase [Methanosarcina sp. Mfa9]|uniref:class I SAM-dependent methyltransferase n=1 Tax=Methanosarcina sp. Mfa9 TaxID=3439063 RepID=UPI003F852C9C